MIRTIKKYLKKYHEADLWLELAYVREEKKQALETTTEVQTGFELTGGVSVIQPHIIFSHADVGHNEEETNKIQELYRELDDIPFSPGVAFI
jgi:hypothetical protein